MDLEDTWDDTLVATGVAVTTVSVSLLLEYVLATETDLLLQLSPLVIYFFYLFTHRRLPEAVDRPRNWIALAVVAGIAVLVVSLQTV